MQALLNIGRKSILLLTVLALVASAGSDIPAQARKKKSGPDPAAQAEAELKKNLEPLNEELIKITSKLEGRHLLSPKEAGKLVELKYRLLDMMNQNPQNALLAKPVYQAGVLFTEREAYDDAYEMFHYLAQGLPNNPYAGKARGQLRQLEKKFGPDYFYVDPPPAPAEAEAKPEDAKADAAKK